MRMNGKGFQNMDKAKHLDAAKKGGKNSNNRHKWTSEEAREAGLKGARVRWEKRRTLENVEKEEC